MALSNNVKPVQASLENIQVLVVCRQVSVEHLGRNKECMVGGNFLRGLTSCIFLLVPLVDNDYQLPGVSNVSRVCSLPLAMRSADWKLSQNAKHPRSRPHKQLLCTILYRFGRKCISTLPFQLPYFLPTYDFFFFFVFTRATTVLRNIGIICPRVLPSNQYQ